MAKHTPRPWIKSRYHATVWADGKSGKSVLIADLANREGDNEDADAALIALAPELAEALRAMVAWHSDPDASDDCIQAAADLLAKLDA